MEGTPEAPPSGFAATACRRETREGTSACNTVRWEVCVSVIKGCDSSHQHLQFDRMCSASGRAVPDRCEPQRLILQEDRMRRRIANVPLRSRLPTRRHRSSRQAADRSPPRSEPRGPEANRVPCWITFIIQRHMGIRECPSHPAPLHGVMTTCHGVMFDGSVSCSRGLEPQIRVPEQIRR